jgi:DNA mismatch repair protein MutL
MAKIYQLPREEIQKIAAGEVVERPANIVKELLENSLDAGANHIIIYIEDGGKKLIRIIDDGHGMAYDDARLSILPHTTSKIRCVDDIASVQSFGFRGEALASISAISHFKLTTRTHDHAHAITLLVEEGAIIQEEMFSAPHGTDIRIEDIFYNVPARKKFLKTSETEWRAIVQLIHAYALCYSTHTFTVYHNNKQVYHFPKSAHHDRVHALLVPQDQIEMYQEQSSTSIPNVKVFAGQPSYTRYDRQHIYCFVNNRWIKNHKISQAFIRGYTSLLNDGKYPVGCVFITINPAEIDVNIHPRKEEVVFLHPRRIEELITDTVQKALSQQIGVTHSTPHSMQSLSIPYHIPVKSSVTFASNTSSMIPQITYPQDLSSFSQVAPTQQVQTAVFPQEDPFVEMEFNYRLIGQAYDTYIIIERDNGLIIFDQHAAHERILYEQFAARIEQAPTVQLLFPETYTLKSDELSLVMHHQECIKEQGIILDALDATTLVIYAKPVHVQHLGLKDLVHEILTAVETLDFLPVEQLKRELNKKIQAMMACKAAVKAGDQLSREKMHEIIDTLMKTANHTTCPHGRPTWWHMSLHDLAKKFRR